MTTSFAPRHQHETPSIPDTLLRQQVRRQGTDAARFVVDILDEVRDELSELPISTTLMGYRAEALAVLRRKVDALTGL